MLFKFNPKLFWFLCLLCLSCVPFSFCTCISLHMQRWTFQVLALPRCWAPPTWMAVWQLPWRKLLGSRACRDQFVGHCCSLWISSSPFCFILGVLNVDWNPTSCGQVLTHPSLPLAGPLNTGNYVFNSENVFPVISSPPFLSLQQILAKMAGHWINLLQLWLSSSMILLPLIYLHCYRRFLNFIFQNSFGFQWCPLIICIYLTF